MTKRFIVFVTFIFLTAIIFGQRENSNSKLVHQFGIDLGGVHYQVRDDIVAPLRYDGIGFLGTFSYSVIGVKGRHNIDLQVLYASLSNRYDHINRVAEFNLAYSYVRKTIFNESIGQFHFGGLIDWSYNLQYYDNWDDSHFYWLNVYELGPVIEWSNTVGDYHHLVINFSFPLIALVSRPPMYRYYDQLKLDKIYSETHENIELTSLNNYLAFGLSGQYMYQVSRKFTLGVGYFLNYKAFSKPERINLFTNKLQLSLLFTLGNIDN